MDISAIFSATFQRQYSWNDLDLAMFGSGGSKRLNIHGCHLTVYQAVHKLQCNACLKTAKPHSCVHVGRSVQAHYSMDLKCCLDSLSQVLIARIVQHVQGLLQHCCYLSTPHWNLRLKLMLEVWENCTITSVTLIDCDASRMEERC